MPFNFDAYLKSLDILPSPTPNPEAGAYTRPVTTQSSAFPWQVKHLTGGFTNTTARVTFTEPVTLSNSPLCPGKFASAILKHAPPTLASDPNESLSVSRQLVEARALALIAGKEAVLEAGEAPVQTQVLKEVLDRYPLIHIPSVIWHDTDQNVLWIEDLGELGNVAEVLASDAAARDSAINELAAQLGSFLAEFYQGSKTIPGELFDRLTVESDTVVGGILQYLVNATRIALEEVPGVDEDEKTELVGRVENALYDIRNVPKRRCLGMVDFWPGSVLVDANWETFGLIDWEYFGKSDEASELGMFLAHFHLTILKPSISKASVSRLGNFVATMFEHYNRSSGSQQPQAPFQRRLLLSYGREMVYGFTIYEYLKDQVLLDAKMAGIRALRAAGPDADTLNLQELWKGGDRDGVHWLRSALQNLGFATEGGHNLQGVPSTQMDYLPE
ncbi:kinase-like domain-containing protein [Ephemerocybe angulata]|uniref:Kinase-like domain-containing protein n=1 Tax=Ephemerocybe angulata TaxID=980116 RepID=A0A8H6H8B8_9AGAR|nr:kinase-like domain-containing protein [Tulosesus angulatus]